jgi:hypothetical protein
MQELPAATQQPRKAQIVNSAEGLLPGSDLRDPSCSYRSHGWYYPWSQVGLHETWSVPPSHHATEERRPFETQKRRQPVSPEAPKALRVQLGRRSG